MKYAIGIDPPKGYAVWCCTTGKFVSLETTDFWGTIERIDAVRKKDQGVFTVYVEAPQENPPVWKHKGATNERSFAKVCQNVGENKGAAKLIISYCLRHGVDCVAVKPTHSSWTKMNHEMFSKITGFDKRVSEHARDAAMLVWGR